MDSFHRTGTSPFQHPNTQVEGAVHGIPTLDCEIAASVKKTISSLNSYTIAPSPLLKRNILARNTEIKADCQLITQGLQEECRCPEQVRQAANLNTFNGDQDVSYQVTLPATASARFCPSHHLYGVASHTASRHS